jgi:hypothetical protein
MVADLVQILGQSYGAVNSCSAVGGLSVLLTVTVGNLINGKASSPVSHHSCSYFVVYFVVLLAHPRPDLK